ncbi:uncharacterized protein VTP21DRAFT_2702 [Calcarisporiella thermophila]|uniref:uncharacterized protein n=1 Tax=Calcarisporiella thermophila TaxID=911321 RepID=UPI003744A055
MASLRDSPWDYDPMDTWAFGRYDRGTDRFGDRFLGERMGYDRGGPDYGRPGWSFTGSGNYDERGFRIPRHVGSRVMTAREGDVVWRPATDVTETDQDLLIVCDLPGVPKEHVQLNMRDEDLVIEGETPDRYPGATSCVRERNIGKFRKHVHLPAGVDRNKIRANCDNGILEIRIPKGSYTSRINIS